MTYIPTDKGISEKTQDLKSFYPLLDSIVDFWVNKEGFVYDTTLDAALTDPVKFGFPDSLKLLRRSDRRLVVRSFCCFLYPCLSGLNGRYIGRKQNWRN